MLHYRFVKIDRTFNYNELAEFGSQTSLSAIKGVNQSVMRFTPFFYTQKSTTGVAFTGQRIFRGSIYLGTVGI